MNLEESFEVNMNWIPLVSIISVSETKPMDTDNLLDKIATDGQIYLEATELTVTAAQLYLEATELIVEFDNSDYPTDLNKYINKVEKYAQGIEQCWDKFSPESQEFFVNLAENFIFLAKLRFEGKGGWLLRIKLFLPSIYHRENLFNKYKASYLSIPKAVVNALKLRKK